MVSPLVAEVFWLFERVDQVWVLGLCCWNDPRYALLPPNVIGKSRKSDCNKHWCVCVVIVRTSCETVLLQKWFPVQIVMLIRILVFVLNLFLIQLLFVHHNDYSPLPLD